MMLEVKNTKRENIASILTDTQIQFIIILTFNTYSDLNCALFISTAISNAFRDTLIVI